MCIPNRAAGISKNANAKQNVEPRLTFSLSKRQNAEIPRVTETTRPESKLYAELNAKVAGARAQLSPCKLCPVNGSALKVFERYSWCDGGTKNRFCGASDVFSSPNSTRATIENHAAQRQNNKGNDGPSVLQASSTTTNNRTHGVRPGHRGPGLDLGLRDETGLQGWGRQGQCD